MAGIPPLALLSSKRFETPSILKALAMASRKLAELAEQGFLQKQKIGRTNYYVNVVLNRILNTAT